MSCREAVRKKEVSQGEHAPKSATQRRLAISGSLPIRPPQGKKTKQLLPDGHKRSTLDGEQMCVVWREAWCLCSLHWRAHELLCVGFSGESATSCRSLIYRCILMFSALAGRPACSPTPPPSVCLCRWFLLFGGEVTAMRGLGRVAFWERPPPECLHVCVCVRVCTCVPAP